MENLFEFLQSLSPEQKAMLCGLAASVFMYILRFIPAVWEEITEYGKKKFRGTLVAVFLAMVAAFVAVFPDGFQLAAFVWLFAINFISSQGAHTAAKNITRAVMGD